MAAAAALFAACAETDFVNEAAVVEGNAPQAIGFEGFAGKSTRAEIADITALQGVGFKVWGYKDGTSLWQNTGTATSEEVTYANGKWGYTNTRYWDKNATYAFYAVAPASGSASWTGTAFSITDAKSGVSTADDVKDYLTATREGVTRNDNKDDTADASVNFDFGHVMSKVSVVLKRSETISQELVVTNVRMTGWNDNDGTYNSAGETLADKWTMTNGGTGNAIFLANGTDKVTTGTTLGTSYLIIPQEVASLTFTVSYTLDGVPYNNQTVALADQTWNVNQHTTYTLTIGPEAILFGVDEVLGWTTATGAGAIN